MEKRDVKQFTETMMGMAENYPGTRLTGNGLKLRFEALKGYSLEQVTNAAAKLLREHRFNSMPTVGDFIQAMDGTGGLSLEQRAEIEAGKILDHLRLHGATKAPRMEDLVTRHLMTHRWNYRSWAARVQESDLEWWKRDFIRAYLTHQAGTVAGCFPALGKLTGDIWKAPGLPWSSMDETGSYPKKSC